jgi:hypothetical protein
MTQYLGIAEAAATLRDEISFLLGNASPDELTPMSRRLWEFSANCAENIRLFAMGDDGESERSTDSGVKE